MNDGSAQDLISRARQIVTHVTLLLAGFPCTSKTKLSSQSSENAYCIQQGNGDTGKGYAAVRKVVALTLPLMVALENLRLDWDPDDTGYTDLEYRCFEMTT